MDFESADAQMDRLRDWLLTFENGSIARNVASGLLKDGYAEVSRLHPYGSLQKTTTHLECPLEAGQLQLVLSWRSPRPREPHQLRLH